MSAARRHITFEFRPDGAVLEKVRTGALLTQDPGDWEQMLFELPTRFAIGGVELLEPEPHGTVIEAGSGYQELRLTDTPVSPNPWLPMPVIGLAVLGMKAVEGVQAMGETAIWSRPT